MANRSCRRQRTPLRVPNDWSGQSRALIAQLETLLDDIYMRLTAQALQPSAEFLERLAALENQLARLTEENSADY